MTPLAAENDNEHDVFHDDARVVMTTQETDETAPQERRAEETTTTATTTTQNEKDSTPPSMLERVKGFYSTNRFLILVLIVILLAYAYPPLGADYLRPKITAVWIAVILIFVMAGLSLKTEEFSKAFQRFFFNSFIHLYNFGFVSALVYGFSRLLISLDALERSLADGMVICSCLPLTVNMVMVLTKSSGGDEAAALFNAAFGNMLGVFLSPALILAYLGVSGDLNLGEVFLKLALRVALPVLVGQLIQKTSPAAVQWSKKHKKQMKDLQEYSLVFIVYTVFCRTFQDGSEATVGDIMFMIFLQLVLLCFVMVVAWNLLKLLFPSQPALRVMGLYGCSHKTVAMGVPLINAIYEDNPAVGLYTLPLLIWHPMQLVMGTFLAPRLAALVQRETMAAASTPSDAGNGEAEAEKTTTTTTSSPQQEP